MKSQLSSFLSGVLVTLALIVLPVSALASDGSFSHSDAGERRGVPSRGR